jgi:hypothetical protein
LQIRPTITPNQGFPQAPISDGFKEHRGRQCKEDILNNGYLDGRIYGLQCPSRDFHRKAPKKHSDKKGPSSSKNLVAVSASISSLIHRISDLENNFCGPRKGAGGGMGVWAKNTFSVYDSICKITFLEILVIESSAHRQ